MADELLLFDIYSAGEQAIPGVSSEILAREISVKFPKVTLVTVQNFESTLDQLVNNEDAILMQGAGNIGQLAASLVKNLRETA